MFDREKGLTESLLIAVIFLMILLGVESFYLLNKSYESRNLDKERLEQQLFDLQLKEKRFK